MKFYTTLPEKLKPFFEMEISRYKTEMTKGNLQNAWKHLERAHILGQRYPFAHNAVHFKMLIFGFKIKSSKEILGQIPRLVLGGVKSFVGTVPIGNTGGADVPPLKSFPINEELQSIFLSAGIKV